MNNKTSGVRWLLINGLEKDQLIDFIRKKDASSQNKSLEKYSGKELRTMALDADGKARARKRVLLIM